jgi:hypothetical protein
MPSGGKHFPERSDSRLKPRHIVAERFAKSTRFKEIPLHVYDHKRGLGCIDGEGGRLSIEFYAWHGDLRR